MSKLQATREEQFFFTREMREERIHLWKMRRIDLRLRSALYALYEWLSGYGASVRRPTIGFVVLCIGFAALYAASSSTAIVWLPGRPFDGAQTGRWLVYSFVN